MKAVISNKIYISVDAELKDSLMKELTYTLYRTVRGGKKISYKERKYIVVRDNILAIPVGREDLIPETHEVVDKRSQPVVDFPPFRETLRPSQKDVVDNITGSAIINAQPSWGKTFCGVAIAQKLGLKTLVIVHTLFLLDQWIAEVEKTLGITPGVITGGKYNIDSPIVISNVQSLKKHVGALTKEFGTVIVDEAHHTPASTFTSLMGKLNAKNRIGLSATLNRKDGLGVFLTGFFSTKVFTPPEENHMKPRVLTYNTGIEFNDDNSVPWALRLNELYNEPGYQNIVLTLANSFVEQGYPTLVVSNRVSLLEHLHEILEEDSILITGATKNREALLEQVKSGEKSLIFGTSSIFAEGVNIPRLACLISAQPINNATLIQQLTGRIARVYEGKKDPIAVDLILEGKTARKQYLSRLQTYAALGYTVDPLPRIE